MCVCVCVCVCFIGMLGHLQFVTATKAQPHLLIV